MYAQNSSLARLDPFVKSWRFVMMRLLTDHQGDEKRPRCGSCQERSVTCEYKQWAFVSEVASAPSDIDNTPGRNQDMAQSPVFAQDDLLSLPKAASPVRALNHSPPNAVYSAKDSGTETAPFDTSPAVSLARTYESTGNQILTPSTWDDKAGQCKQRAMHCFRYQLVPWIESNAPKPSFGSNMMTLAQDKPVIMDAAIYLARHRTSRGETSSEELQELHHRLLLENTFVGDVGRSLLALGDLFNGGPSLWPQFRFYHQQPDTQPEPLEDIAEPLKSLLRFHIKIDIATSIMTNKPPSMKLPLSTGRPLSNASLSPMETYDSCLLCLLECVRLIHYELIPLFAGQSNMQSAAPESYSLKWAAWSSLWTSCMQWFQDRPPGMQPVLESSDADLNGHKMQESSFPADVYTSAVSLQANLTMHLSSLLLLAYKPRLVKLSRFPHRLVSRSWHTQKIARLAVWNNFPEQWDPLVVAALLRAAREMTHVSQQEALLDCFQRITDLTKLPLDEEISSLRLYWRSSSHGTPPTMSNR
ncbi:hypothetical protein CEP52_005603 [Fusarium oligoseptatum]|uniref:Zn(2)-C6 fungal-type domain-containing protein n=1 Tax=Fusarium oligoseptatum TaxID=2604345 RepID=A0A428TXE6_9HYPO|nr:hypothetical protein CEP52_005603 [Fusarium oligoseptatum]